MAPWGPGATPAARAAGERTQAGILDGSFQIFKGPIADRSGKTRVAAGAVMPDADVLRMDWLVEGT